jgi:hypothetical protein
VADGERALAREQDLLAPQEDLGLSRQRHVRAVGAEVDVEELIAAPLEAPVQARGGAVRDHDLIGAIAADQHDRQVRAERQRALGVRDVQPRLRALAQRRPGRGLRELLGVLPQQLVHAQLFLLALERQRVQVTRGFLQRHRQPGDAGRAGDDLTRLGQRRQAGRRVHGVAEHVARLFQHRPQMEADAHGEPRVAERRQLRNARLHVHGGLSRRRGIREHRHDLVADGLHETAPRFVRRAAQHVDHRCHRGQGPLIAEALV